MSWLNSMILISWVFQIALDGEGYTERVDFTPEQFCQMLRNDRLPTTAQIAQFRLWSGSRNTTVGRGAGALYPSTRAAAAINAAAHAAAAQFHEEHPESFDEIFIVDSHAYSMAEARA